MCTPALAQPLPAAPPSANPEVSEAFFHVVSQQATQVANKAADLVLNALNLIGVNYRYGGNTPSSGLDCSGFVRYVYKNTFDLILPRRSVEISKIGEKVNQADLKPGDLVFFNTMHTAFSHVGIYIGNNKFVHAPATGKKIRIDNMKAAYWTKRYNGARRIDTEDIPEEFKIDTSFPIPNDKQKAYPQELL
jgi:cell wall-associated NlpC family hydrolase